MLPSVADVMAHVAEELPAAAELRHRLHADPRRSGDEADTAEAVCAAIGEPAQVVASTGRMLRTGPSDGTSVVLRAELDGLPLIERSTVPWRSRSAVMHACGHDVHCAAVAAVARAAPRIGLPVGLLVLLQPREEGNISGAADVVADPAFQAHQPAAVIGAHVQPELLRGEIGAAPGPINASADVVEIVIEGRGGHGAYPHRTDDPVLALAQVVTALHHLVSRRVDPTRAASLTVGMVQAGEVGNIIPETARAKASLRLLDPRDREPLQSAIRSTVVGIAQAYGCRATVTFIDVLPVLVNDPALAAATVLQLDGTAFTPASFRSCGADDFSFYGAYPSVMLFVGTGDGTPGAPGLHHPEFVPPDDVIVDVATAYAAGMLGALAVLGA